MAFRVEISPRALQDLDEIARYIGQQGSFRQAQDWFDGIIAAIRTLEEFAERSRVAEESKDLRQEIRLLLYGKRNHKYRVYYSVQHKTPSQGTVQVFHVRHWARKSMKAEQFRELMGSRII